MNLIEAIKSGKTFRRPGREWVSQAEVVNWWYCQVDFEDLMADDWETGVSETLVPVTRAMLHRALTRAMNRCATLELTAFRDALTEELGL